MANVSRPVKFRNLFFRYDFDKGFVEMLYKVPESELELDKEFFEENGFHLWEVDEEGFAVLRSYRLREADWNDEIVRGKKMDKFAKRVERYVRFDLVGAEV